MFSRPPKHAQQPRGHRAASRSRSDPDRANAQPSAAAQARQSDENGSEACFPPSTHGAYHSARAARLGIRVDRRAREYTLAFARAHRRGHTARNPRTMPLVNARSKRPRLRPLLATQTAPRPDGQCECYTNPKADSVRGWRWRRLAAASTAARILLLFRRNHTGIRRRFFAFPSRRTRLAACAIAQRSTHGSALA